MGWPEFIVVGAPKCGTTALHAYLRDQDGVFVPELKEPHFFAPDIPIRRRLHEREYLDLFAGAPQGVLTGEVSVWYLYSETAAAAIRRRCGEIRIVAMLRNPLEAMHALHGQFVFNGDEDIGDFEAALAAEDDRLEGGRQPKGSWVGARCLCYRQVYRYAEQIQRYLDAFGPQRLHIVLYDDFARDTEGTYRAVLDFLDVPWQGPRDLRPVHRHRRLRWSWLKGLERRYEIPLRRLARRWIPQDDRRRRLGKRLIGGLRRLNSQQVRRPPLPPTTLARLRREMAPDVRRLEAQIGRRTGWLQED